MMMAHDEITAAFDALSLAVESAPSRNGKMESFLVASMSPTDSDENKDQMDDFRTNCLKAAETQCVLMFTLIL